MQRWQNKIDLDKETSPYIKVEVRPKGKYKVFNTRFYVGIYLPGADPINFILNSIEGYRMFRRKSLGKIVGFRQETNRTSFFYYTPKISAA